MYITFCLFASHYFVVFSLSRYVIYTLHSAVQHSDQKQAFKVPPRGMRKIVSVYEFQRFTEPILFQICHLTKLSCDHIVLIFMLLHFSHKLCYESDLADNFSFKIRF